MGTRMAGLLRRKLELIESLQLELMREAEEFIIEKIKERGSNRIFFEKPIELVPLKIITKDEIISPLLYFVELDETIDGEDCVTYNFGKDGDGIAAYLDMEDFVLIVEELSKDGKNRKNT